MIVNHKIDSMARAITWFSLQHQASHAELLAVLTLLQAGILMNTDDPQLRALVRAVVDARNIDEHAVALSALLDSCCICPVSESVH